MFRANLCELATTALGAQEQKQPQAPQTDIALARVLAVDASDSVSDDRFELQRQGYATAFILKVAFHCVFDQKLCARLLVCGDRMRE
jgi:hypothetical protein